MMPNTSVNPAASMNSRRPNCSPFRHCSMNSVMMPSAPPNACKQTAAARLRRRRLYPNPRLFHRALTVISVLVVLDDGGDGLEHEVALSVLHHILEIECLDRKVVVIELKVATHRLKV